MFSQPCSLNSIKTRWLGGYTLKTAFWWMEMPDTHQTLEMPTLGTDEEKPTLNQQELSGASHASRLTGLQDRGSPKSVRASAWYHSPPHPSTRKAAPERSRQPTPQSHHGTRRPPDGLWSLHRAVTGILSGVVFTMKAPSQSRQQNLARIPHSQKLTSKSMPCLYHL